MPFLVSLLRGPELAAEGVAPRLPPVALSSGDAWLQVGKPGATAELGGTAIDAFDGSLAKAAAAQD